MPNENIPPPIRMLVVVAAAWTCGMERIALRAQKIEDALAQCAREHQPKCGPSRCEQQTLAQRLPNQPAAGSPERQAQRKFTLPGAGAGKHEIGEIGARDQQDEAG